MYVDVSASPIIFRPLGDDLHAGVRIMSDAELTKFEILRDVDHEWMPVRAAAQVLGLTER